MKTETRQIPLNFPYRLYFYGSVDSLDTDVIIEIPRDEMPLIQEDRKVKLKLIESQYEIEWNCILAVIENGYISDTIYPKTWIDSLNNALLETYSLHEQYFSNPVCGKMPRNRLLAIYKTLRTIMSVLTRTHLRGIIRPVVNGVHPFEDKMEAVSRVFLPEITDFHQRNMLNTDIWKTIAFYIGQNLSLITSGIEIYTKKDLLKYHPSLASFILRKPLLEEDKYVLQDYLEKWLQMTRDFGTFTSEGTNLYCKEEAIDMKKEIYLTSKNYYE
ncbi:MAG: hypothetical protein K1X92_15040 [Bacteroidia bacterium]|nr:hypothetical protein [Bacteroidia bacterium]